jgi:hypothetical protein
MCAAHVLKYVHNLSPIGYDAITLGSYWADNETYSIVKVLSSKPLKDTDIDLLHVEYLNKPGSRIAIQSDDLRSDFTRIEKPKSEKPFYWFFKLFEKRRTLTLHDVETQPHLKHLYVMNALTMKSVSWHRKQVLTNVPFPIPQMLIGLQNEKGRTEVLKIPPSFVPVDLLDQFKASILFEANDFRRAVKNGHLYILDPKYAQSLLKLPEFVAEVERMKQAQEYVEDQAQLRTLTEDQVNAPPSNTQPPYYSDLEFENSNKSPNPNTMSKSAEFYRADSIEPLDE